MVVNKDKKRVLNGTRGILTFLWMVLLEIPDQPTHQSYNIHQVNSKENSIKYLHSAAFSPVQDTWVRAINRGYFNTWPLITVNDINNIPKSEVNIKGHLTKIRNQTQSTTTNKNIGDKNENTDTIQEKHNNKTDIVIDTVDETHKIYTDQTGNIL